MTGKEHYWKQLSASMAKGKNGSNKQMLKLMNYITKKQARVEAEKMAEKEEKKEEDNILSELDNL